VRAFAHSSKAVADEGGASWTMRTLCATAAAITPPAHLFAPAPRPRPKRLVPMTRHFAQLRRVQEQVAIRKDGKTSDLLGDVAGNTADATA
jgi:hypothetical protein